jgi:hypothetical protein
MKQVTLCVFGNGYTEPYNCAVEFAPGEQPLIPNVGDEVRLPGMETAQIVRNRSFNYSERGILVLLNYDNKRLPDRELPK